MAITKPTDNILWAETPGDPSDVLDPSAKRPAGYQEGDPIYYNNLNYLLRALGRGVDFAKDALGSASDRLSLSGAHGYLKLDADPANVGAGPYHILRHYASGTGVAAQLASGILKAHEGIVSLGDRSNLVGQSLAGDPLVEVSITDSDLTAPTRLEVGSFKTASNAPSVAGQTYTDTLHRRNLVKAQGSALFDGSSWTLHGLSYNLDRIDVIGTGHYRVFLLESPPTATTFGGAGQVPCVQLTLGSNSGTSSPLGTYWLQLGRVGVPSLDFLCMDAGGVNQNLPTGAVVHITVY